MALPEKNIEILYDHYKDSFENQKAYINKRNLYTLICLMLIAFLSIQITAPKVVDQLSDELIKKNVGNLVVDFKYINSIILFGLLWVVIMYYQSIFIIEKMYKYIHGLEEQLTVHLNPVEIKREGKNYLKNYPILLSLIHRIYTWFFPILLILVSVAKWMSEYQVYEGQWMSFYFICDTVILFLITSATILYLSNRHFNDFRKKE